MFLQNIYAALEASMAFEIFAAIEASMSFKRYLCRFKVFMPFRGNFKALEVFISV